MRIKLFANFFLLLGVVLLGGGVGPATPVCALDSGDYYLRLLGNTVLSTTVPTASTVQFKDSSAVNRTTYREIGVWTAPLADSSLRLSTTAPLYVWLGLKNSDDQGSYFDVRAELRKNGVVIASGETKDIRGVTRNANQAKEIILTFGNVANAQFTMGDEFSLRILAKVADSGGHNNATGVRLYYGAATRPARFGATFSAINTPPAANAGTDQTGLIGETLHLDGSHSSDIDGDSLTYQWSLTAKPAGSSAVLANSTTVSPSLTLDKPGNYTCQLIVNDGLVDSASDTVVLSTVNSAPVADAGADQTGLVGQTVHLNGSGSSDMDGGALMYQWTLPEKPAGSSTTLTNPTSVTPALTLDKPGNYIGQLVVNDGFVNSASDTVVISTVNSAPVANAGPDQTGLMGATIQLDGSHSSDVDGDALTYQWSFTFMPLGSLASLSDPTIVQPTFVLDAPGTYVLQLLVNDGVASSTPASVTINTVNSQPLANAGPDQSAQVGVRVYLDGSGSADVDGDALTYQWAFTAQPANSTASLDDPAAVSASFIPDKPGAYTMQLMVNDGAEDSLPDTVVVSTLNSKPVANAGPVRDVFVGATVLLEGGSSTDADGDPLTYHWSLTAVPSGSSAALTSEETVTAIFTPDVAGVYVAQLIVNDGALDSEPDTATVTVTAVDATPPPPADPQRITLGLVTQGQVIVTGAAGSVEENAQITLTNNRTGQTVVVTATADGGFMLEIAAQNGDILSIVVIDSAGNASATTTTPVGSLTISLASPTAGATVQEGALLVRGTIEGGGGEVGVTVNDTPALVQNSAFLALVPVNTATTNLTMHAVSAAGESATTIVPLLVVTTTGPALDLSASPYIGVAPLTTTFALMTGTMEVTQVTLDANGDGQDNFTGATLDDQAFTYTGPGLYEPTATVTDAQGQQFTVRGIVRVYDQAVMDALLQAKWTALKDALRRGDIIQALTQIHSQARARYAAIFQALAADLPDVDSILTPITLLEVRGGEAIYEMVRTDDTTVKSFELRFRIDDDGIWRLAMF